MRTKIAFSVMLLALLFLSGCGNNSLSNNLTTYTTEIIDEENDDKKNTRDTVGVHDSTDNSKENYEVFKIEDLNDKDYFESFLKEARTIAPSEIIAEDVDHVVYSFMVKNQKPEIDWYDCNDHEIEHLSFFDSPIRYIHTVEYENNSLPSVNSFGDALEYLAPYSEHDGYCMYDENGRLITEFSNNGNDSSELYQYSYYANGKLARKTHIEIDYYDIDWGDMAVDSDFSEDEAFEAVIDSVHLDYYYDDYTYNSDNLLVRIDTYQAGDKEPFLYEKYEYDNNNRISRSYTGYYDEETINTINYYEYY